MPADSAPSARAVPFRASAAPEPAPGAPAAQSAAPSGPGASASSASSFRPAGQRFTFAQYASLRVELEAHPERRAQTLLLYGLAAEGDLSQVEAVWKRAFAEQPALAARFEELRGEYQRYVSTRRSPT